MSILTVNLLLSTLVFWIAARIYLLPRLHELKPRTILLPILLLHSYLDLMFLAPGVLGSCAAGDALHRVHRALEASSGAFMDIRRLSAHAPV